MKRYLLILLAGLSACSSTPKDLEQKASAARATKEFSENYQEIYRRVSGAASRCNAGNINAYASYNVNSQLYNELGFGEVNLSMINLGQANFFWTAKIEKSGAGSKLTVTSGNSLAQDRMLNSVVRWASGDDAC